MVQITSLLVALVLAIAVSAAPVEKRQINFGSGNGIGNGNFGVRPCKRLAPGNYGSGNQIGNGNGIICTREEDEVLTALEKRQINFGSGNGIGNGNFKYGPCKRQIPGGGNFLSGNQGGDGNGIICTREEEEVLTSLQKRQINFGSGNDIGNGNFQLKPCKRLAPGNYGSGNQIGNGNGIACAP